MIHRERTTIYRQQASSRALGWKKKETKAGDGSG